MKLLLISIFCMGLANAQSVLGPGVGSATTAPTNTSVPANGTINGVGSAGTAMPSGVPGAGLDTTNLNPGANINQFNTAPTPAPSTVNQSDTFNQSTLTTPNSTIPDGTLRAPSSTSTTTLPNQTNAPTSR